MQTQAFGDILLGKHVQQQLVVHMARSFKVLRHARQHLALTDFDWEVCQVVAHTLYKYHDLYGQLPTFEILAYEVQQTVQGARGDVIPLHDAEYEHLAYLLEQVRSTPDNVINPQWALNALDEYLMQVRVKRFNVQAEQALRTGVGIGDIAREGANLVVSTSTASQIEFVDAFDISRFPVYNREVQHITTGLTRMDRALGGGPKPGELGLLAACQGVGKTNAMLNMLLSAVNAGWYGLFLSLEMPVISLQQRTIAMAAHIMAKRFREGALETFREDELRRLYTVNKNMMTGRLQYVDLSTQSATLAMIETAVDQWLEKLEKTGARDKAGLICIDYMDLISHGHVVGRGKGDLEPDVLKQLMDSIKKKLVNRTRVSTVIATQATSAAEGQQIFHRKHVAWGFHKVDAIDYGFGIAQRDDDRLSQLEDGDDDLDAAEAAGITEHGRHLSFSFFKMREGESVAFNVYQAPTLRLYNTKREYTAIANAIAEGEYAHLFTGGRT